MEVCWLGLIIIIKAYITLNFMLDIALYGHSCLCLMTYEAHNSLVKSTMAWKIPKWPGKTQASRLIVGAINK